MTREIRVGVMVAVSLVILGITIFYIGNFEENLRYHIRFYSVNGLETDSPVHFNGVPVGRVTDIELSEFTKPNEPVSVKVTIAVHQSLENHIRVSTVADIKSIGVLGDKYILLVTPDYQSEVLPEDSFIAPKTNTLDVDQLLKQGTDFVADVTDMTANLKKVLDQVATKDGVLQRLIGDEALARSLSTSLSQVLSNIETRQSLVGAMLNDPEFSKQVRRDLTNSLGGLARMVEQFDSDENMIGLMLTDKAFKDEVRQKTLALLDKSNRYADSLLESRGLMYRLVQDEAYGERIAQNIEKASHHLASILEKIDQGDGTAALLVNDPSLYQGIYQVVYGLEHSGISKWYIQKKRKKGSKMLGREPTGKDSK